MKKKKNDCRIANCYHTIDAIILTTIPSPSPHITLFSEGCEQRKFNASVWWRARVHIVSKKATARESAVMDCVMTSK